MTISKQELVDGIRFAGQRAAAALDHVQEFDYQLGHEWTTADAFRHVAQTAGGLSSFWPALENTERLSQVGIDAVASSNASNIEKLGEKSRDELRQMILDGAEVSAAFAETLDEDDLATVVTLGGYEMPKGELAAQIWIHHQIAHSYEASARWPIL
ncbi:MAG: hypothetical protein HOH95_00730 [Dehalococcoidia bacterium]|jgi:hypothetical protein|nr:hypothetical protein [Dehalococcoidia bacterium]